MNKKIEAWCYGGKSKAFFISQIEAIHQYNSKMLNQLMLVMTIIIGTYLTVSTESGIFSRYSTAYLVCFVALLALLVTFRWKAHKGIILTRIYIILFSVVMFAFVCILGTVYDSGVRATLYIVYLLAFPMLFIIPTHYMYSFLSVTTGIFSTMALRLKVFDVAGMDVAHSVTCLVIGLLLSHHVLESRIALYVLNEQLDQHNLQLDKQLHAKEVELIQSRIAIMLSQIQPHFLFNTLTAICGLCDENPKEAKKVTTEFADYLRHNLDSLTQSNPIPFEDELHHTKVYLTIEQKRFEGRLKLVYDITVADFHIPALTIQPIVENAVKHGVTKKKGGGTVTVSTREQEHCYEIIIADNGVGFESTQPLDESDTHIGIENVSNRLWSICQGKLTVVSEIDVGTVATISIPKGKIHTDNFVLKI